LGSGKISEPSPTIKQQKENKMDFENELDQDYMQEAYVAGPSDNDLDSIESGDWQWDDDMVSWEDI